MNWLNDILKVVTTLEPIVVPLLTSNRDVKHDIKPIS